ncbi:MAG TPA: ORF6N domain-containing protein [Bacteroidales bacterium]|nr:ORF6N domain-containing protein [Bacteroidales bacterium]
MEEEMLIPYEKIDRAILLIRGRKVMLDADLAIIYGVKTFRLNEQVKRNRNRFPEDFMFQLTDEEKREVIANCDHLERLKFASTNPYAFTEHGAIMLASVLNTPLAIQASVLVVRSFVRLRELLVSNRELAGKLKDLETKVDKNFATVFRIFQELMKPPDESSRPKIGFKIGDKEAGE